MQIEQLQIILGGLALALALLVGFAFRSRLPALKLPRIALPRIRLASRASKGGDEPEVQLSSERLARLRLDMTEAEDDEAEEAEPQEAQADTDVDAEGEAEALRPFAEEASADFAISIERRLEEAFNLLEAGTIDMADYRLRLGEIDATIAAAETDMQSGTDGHDPDQVLRAREAMEWCKQWASEYDPDPIAN